VVVLRGLCVSLEALEEKVLKQVPESESSHDYGSFMHTWSIQEGKLQDKVKIDLWLDKIDPQGVYKRNKCS